jgi:hypothetical protein
MGYVPRLGGDVHAPAKPPWSTQVAACGSVIATSSVVRIRIKTIHLRNPAHASRWQVKQETLTSDKPFSLELLAAHMANATLMAQLPVSYAELQIRLRTDIWSRKSRYGR